jgi:hypothetical protein
MAAEAAYPTPVQIVVAGCANGLATAFVLGIRRDADGFVDVIIDMRYRRILLYGGNSDTTRPSSDELFTQRRSE